MGASSTGKTTLAEILAQHYQTAWAPEFLRLFVDQKGAVPEENDVFEIARGQLDLVARMKAKAHRVLFIDTDLFTTCVYQRIYFNSCPKSIEEMARIHQSELYLFMEPDIPWVPDPGQRENPEARLHSHGLLSAEAKKRSLNTVPISGSYDKRLKKAVKVVDHYLSSLNSPGNSG